MDTNENVEIRLLPVCICDGVVSFYTRINLWMIAILYQFNFIENRKSNKILKKSKTILYQSH